VSPNSVQQPSASSSRRREAERHHDAVHQTGRLVQHARAGDQPLELVDAPINLGRSSSLSNWMASSPRFPKSGDLADQASSSRTGLVEQAGSFAPVQVD
jgi:hypothetical protein